MDKLGFKAKEICAILESCAKAGVKHFKVGELEIKFEEPPIKVQSTDEPVQLEFLDHADVNEEIEEFQTAVDDPDGFEKAQIARCFESVAGDN
jgi:hypothetical protein